MEYYETELLRAGFKRNTTVYAPDRKLAVSVYDYTSDEESYDGGMLRYVRIQDDMLEVVILDVNVYVKVPKNCDGTDRCKVETTEKYALFMSEKIPLDKFVAIERTKGGVMDTLASLIRAI